MRSIEPIAGFSTMNRGREKVRRECRFCIEGASMNKIGGAMAIPEANQESGIGRESTARALERGASAAELYPVLLLVALVFIAIFPWHVLNQRLPFWDGANFVLTSQKIADAFDDGVLAGVKGLYLERWWRPIIFPSLAAPFFLLSGGQIRLSVGLAQLTFALVMAVYIYYFLRQEYSSRRALTGSLLILAAPWFVNWSRTFLSELSWLAATAGMVYHTSAALRRSSRSHYMLAGVWLGLMGAVRPVETVVIVFLPAVTFLAYAVKRGGVKVADVALFSVQLLTTAIAVGLLAMAERPRFVVVSLLVASLAIIGLRARRFWVDSALLASFVCAELIALAWHLPTIRTLYLWAESTSFGSLAQLPGQYSGLSPFAILGQLVEEYSPRLLLTVVALAAADAPTIFRPARNALHSHAWPLIGAAVLMIVPMFVLYSWSATSDPRRIMPGMLILYMGVIALALAPQGARHYVREASLLGITVALLIAAAASGLNINSSGLLKVQSTFGYLSPPFVGQDPTVPALESLLQMGISSGNISAYTHCYHANCDADKIPWIEPVALSTLARERHVPLNVHFMIDLDFSKPETLSKQIMARDFQYVLVDMLDSPGPVNHADPYVEHTDQFLSMERSALPPGLISRGCFSALNRPMCVVEVDRNQR
jgi:hypothetical protein